MSEIITVPIEDLHRRPNARALDDDLVKSLAASMALVGFSPAKPVVVRRDGGIYWIIDGAHRAAAAEHAGIEEIPAEVEDVDAAGVLIREGAFNLQRPDTEAERWARAQEFLTLGDVDPKAVEVATGVTVEEQPRVARVLSKLNDPVAAEDVSLEQAIAAHEFIDDDEAFSAVMNAGENWKRVYGDFQRAASMAAAVAECEAVIAAAGVEVVEESEWGYVDTSVWHYLARGGDKPENATGARVEKQAWAGTASVVWYEPAQAATEDPEAAARREAADAHRAALSAAQDTRRAFVFAYLNGDSDSLSNALRDFAVTAWEDDESADVSSIRGEYEGAIKWDALKGFNTRVYAAIIAAVEQAVPFNTSAYYRKMHGARTVEYFAALVDCGYEVAVAEQQELDAIAAVLDEGEADDE